MLALHYREKCKVRRISLLKYAINSSIVSKCRFVVFGTINEMIKLNDETWNIPIHFPNPAWYGSERKVFEPSQGLV